MLRALRVLADMVFFETWSPLLDIVDDKAEIPPWRGDGQSLQISHNIPHDEATREDKRTLP